MTWPKRSSRKKKQTDSNVAEHKKTYHSFRNSVLELPQTAEAVLANPARETYKYGCAGDMQEAVSVMKMKKKPA